MWYTLSGLESITKLQSGCRGQAAPPFNQLLYGRLNEPHIIIG